MSWSHMCKGHFDYLVCLFVCLFVFTVVDHRSQERQDEAAGAAGLVVLGAVVDVLPQEAEVLLVHAVFLLWG